MENQLPKQDIQRAGNIIGAFLLLQIASMYLFSYGISLFPKGLRESAYFLSIYTPLISILQNAIPAAGVLLLTHTSLKGWLRPNKKACSGALRAAPLVIGVGLLVSMAVTFLLTALGMEPGTDVVSHIKPGVDLTDNIILFFSLCVLPPILEELLFRGAVMKSLLPFGERFAIAASALTFSLRHMNAAQSITAFSFGLFAAYLDVKYRSLLPSILIHFLNNTFSYVTLIASSTGQKLLVLLLGLAAYVFIIYAVVYMVRNRRRLLTPAIFFTRDTWQRIWPFFTSLGGLCWLYYLVNVGMHLFRILGWRA